MSLAEQIKQRYRAADLPPVPVEAFGEGLFIRHWSGRDRALWESIAFERDGKESKARPDIFMASVVALSLVDAAGQLVFGQDDIEELADLDNAELEPVYYQCVKVVGIDRDLVGQAEKNSVTVHSNGSPSA